MQHRSWIRALTMAAAGIAVSESAARASIARSTPATASSTTPPATTTEPPQSPSPTATPTQTESDPPTPTTTVTPETETAAERLAVATDPRLGEIVTDRDGLTLYRLDTATVSKSIGTRFPPVLLPPGGGIAVNGIDPSLIGTVERPDGDLQVTLAGRPLFRFVDDTAPGDTAGHGVGEVAFAITPTGSKAVARD
jgi:predicted lipoprotein with Yx(FWY)xxD motif